MNSYSICIQSNSPIQKEEEKWFYMGLFSGVGVFALYALNDNQFDHGNVTYFCYKTV